MLSIVVKWILYHGSEKDIHCKWLETSSKNAKNHIMCIKLIQKAYSQLKLVFGINVLSKYRM